METHFRLANAGDASGIHAIFAPVVRDTPTSFELNPPSREEISDRVRSTLRQHPWLVCMIGDQLKGYAYAGSHSGRAAYKWSVNVSVYVAADVRRLGVERALYEALFAILRMQWFWVAFAGITLPNPASVGLHESLGFRPSGVFERVGFKMGQWHDVGYWQISLQSAEGAPEAPVLLPDMMNEPAVKGVLQATSEKFANKGRRASGAFGDGNETELK